MTRNIRATLALVTGLAIAPLAPAQSFRAYLASYGNDANVGCTVSAPCRLLPAALNAVLNGGEVWILDSANFNQSAVSITKDVSILAVPGQVGSLASVASGPAIFVNGAYKVRLRNVVIANNANNPGTHGIVLNSGANLAIEDSLISVVQRGIYATASTASIYRTTFREGTSGVYLTSGSTGDVTESRFVHQSDYSIYVDASGSSTPSVATVTNCSVADGWGGVRASNQSGVASGTAQASVMGSSFSNLVYGVVAVGGTGQTIRIAVGNSHFSQIQQLALYPLGGGVVETLGNNLGRQIGGSSATTVPGI